MRIFHPCPCALTPSTLPRGILQILPFQAVVQLCTFLPDFHRDQAAEGRIVVVPTHDSFLSPPAFLLLSPERQHLQAIFVSALFPFYRTCGAWKGYYLSEEIVPPS